MLPAVRNTEEPKPGALPGCAEAGGELDNVQQVRHVVQAAHVASGGRRS